MHVRAPYFAFQGWYPETEQKCRLHIDAMLAAGSQQPQGSVSGIVPHAGWRFSGALAAQTFAALAPMLPELVFVFGGHMRPGDQPICMTEGAWGTPLGNVLVHEATARALAHEFNCDVETATRFAPDNTIELQLPFIKYFWPEAQVVAVQVPADERSAAIAAWASEYTRQQGFRSIAIGSTDLTHYGTGYGFCPEGAGQGALQWSKESNDRVFLDHVLSLDGKSATAHALRHHSACCPGAAWAALEFARQQAVQRGFLLRHATSQDVLNEPDPAMWVGYASVVF